MAARDAYLDHLGSVPLFAACSRKDLQRIARASDEVSIAEGRALVKQDEIGRECFVLVAGQVNVGGVFGDGPIPVATINGTFVRCP